MSKREEDDLFGDIKRIEELRALTLSEDEEVVLAASKEMIRILGRYTDPDRVERSKEAMRKAAPYAKQILINTATNNKETPKQRQLAREALENVAAQSKPKLD